MKSRLENVKTVKKFEIVRTADELTEEHALQSIVKIMLNYAGWAATTVNSGSGHRRIGYTWFFLDNPRGHSLLVIVELRQWGRPLLLFFWRGKTKLTRFSCWSFAFLTTLVVVYFCFFNLCHININKSDYKEIKLLQFVFEGNFNLLNHLIWE